MVSLRGETIEYKKNMYKEKEKIVCIFRMVDFEQRPIFLIILIDFYFFFLIWSLNFPISVLFSYFTINKMMDLE